MQRETPEGIVLACDFCRRDWDGQEPMVEGHHGSIICLKCVQVALIDLQPAPPQDSADAEAGKSASSYKCNLCLRFNIPGTLAHWRHPANPDAVACRDCLLQAAGTLSKSPHADWKWDGRIAR